MTLGIVQFYKMGAGQTVGKILKEVPFPLEEVVEFPVHARSALAAHRGDKKVWEWPDAIRLVDENGNEVCRWTMVDELNAKQRALQIKMDEWLEARRMPKDHQ